MSGRSLWIPCFVGLMAACACSKKDDASKTQEPPAPVAEQPGAATVGSCMKTDPNAGPVCDESENYPPEVMEAAKQLCTTTEGQQAEWIDGPCPRENSSGGCRKQEGEAVFTTWYYAETVAMGTPAEVQESCGLGSLEYVAP